MKMSLFIPKNDMNFGRTTSTIGVIANSYNEENSHTYTIFPMTRKDIQLVFSGIFVILEIHDNQ